jgi:hypothetical protein
MEDWNEFYKWLGVHGYYIYKDSNIFRHSKFITDFDPLEDADSGEIQETIDRVKANDLFNFKL